MTLGEEMEFLGKYPEIQKLRFADRLDVQIDVPEELYAARVPSLILQPMVENAIKHGISDRGRAAAAFASGQRGWVASTLRVYNDGPTLPVDWESTRSGIGIPNVRTRLQSLYGGDCELAHEESRLRAWKCRSRCHSARRHDRSQAGANSGADRRR